SGSSGRGRAGRRPAPRRRNRGRCDPGSWSGLLGRVGPAAGRRRPLPLRTGKPAEGHKKIETPPRSPPGPGEIVPFTRSTGAVSPFTNSYATGSGVLLIVLGERDRRKAARPANETLPGGRKRRLSREVPSKTSKTKPKISKIRKLCGT